MPPLSATSYLPAGMVPHAYYYLSIPYDARAPSCSITLRWQRRCGVSSVWWQMR